MTTPETRAAGEDTPDNTSCTPKDDRLELLEASYKEVLDATKHQDDKVGRLLTATAFLTAAALGLANLRGGAALSRGYVIDGVELPALTLVALGVFLLAVVFAAVIFIYSIMTPLRIPGFQPSTTAGSQRISQIYFYPIAAASEAAWNRKWQEDNVQELHNEGVEMYRDEVRNLALRADFKYSRTNEGVAILSFALLAFGIGVVLAVTAGLTSCPDASNVTGVCIAAAELSWLPRALLAAVVSGWVFGSLVSRVRYGRLGVEDNQQPINAGRIFGLASAALAGLALLGLANPWRVWASLVGVTVAILVTWTLRDTRPSRGKPPYAKLVNYVGTLVGVWLACGLGVVYAVEGSYSWALCSGLSLPVAISAVGLLGPSAAEADRRVQRASERAAAPSA